MHEKVCELNPENAKKEDQVEIEQISETDMSEIIPGPPKALFWLKLA